MISSVLFLAALVLAQKPSYSPNNLPATTEQGPLSPSTPIRSLTSYRPNRHEPVQPVRPQLKLSKRLCQLVTPLFSLPTTLTRFLPALTTSASGLLPPQARSELPSPSRLPTARPTLTARGLCLLAPSPTLTLSRRRPVSWSFFSRSTISISADFRFLECFRTGPTDGGWARVGARPGRLEQGWEARGDQRSCMDRTRNLLLTRSSRLSDHGRRRLHQDQRRCW